MLIEPHGGRLVNRVLNETWRKKAIDNASKMAEIRIRDDTITDIENIAKGVFSPLEGFMGESDFENVLNRKSLSSGLPWTIPICLDVTKEEAERLEIGEDCVLADSKGTISAILHLEEKYYYVKKEMAEKVFLTADTKHPAVAKIENMGAVLLGGKIDLVNERFDPYRRYNLSPRETRVLFKEKGWRTVVAFQTRNPVHRAHEYIQKCALEIVDGLLLHPLVGETKSDDIPTDIRIKCYETIIRNYYNSGRTVFSVLPVNMRYAGPREAIFHSLVRKNYGCTHFIVGRDHAGVGNYYGTYDAHYIFDEFDPSAIGIQPLFFEHAFYCKKCNGMASAKTCPHPSEDHVFLSGTRVREMLRRGEIPPKEFTRPEVARVLIEGLKETEI
ncbi:sulfate adenylyltransferase [bacterium]|nr:sulfate adenylyltransferase [bacterium]